jgi:hypothetical protein
MNRFPVHEIRTTKSISLQNFVEQAENPNSAFANIERRRLAVISPTLRALKIERDVDDHVLLAANHAAPS